MAIVTGELYKGFTFGDVSSKDYGVYITQEAAYNAPDRDVEVVEIAGRNGAYILDKGRFKNITVSYKCGIALDSEHTFESAIRTFRNALSSKAGKYVRLEDEYNPNEYRQAAFLGGIEVDMADRRAGEFTVSFDAMPQRFLKSGETAVSVASGGTITNPTLFESHPLLHLWGYGTVNMLADDQDSQIVINNDEYGAVLLTNKVTKASSLVSEYFDKSATALLNSNDAVQVSAGSVLSISFDTAIGVVNVTNVSVSNTSTYDMSITYSTTLHGMYFVINFSLEQIDFVYSQENQYKNSDVNVTVNYTQDGTAKTASFVARIHAQSVYSRTRDNISVDLSASVRTSGSAFYINSSRPQSSTMQPIYGISTKRPFSNDADFYIDLDIGEAYREEDGQIINVNNAVTIPAKLPVLKSGANTITYDDTITQFQVVPNWWEV